MIPETNIFTEDSYRRMGTLSQDTLHEKEFTDGFGEFGICGGRILEIGSGVSPYIKMVLANGCDYTGVDTSKFACEENKRRFPVETHCCRIEDFDCDTEFDGVISAHVLEHADNAEKMLVKTRSLIKSGGVLFLIIPDDSDLNNQDHNWFFTIDSAKTMLSSVGFDVVKAESFKIVKHESFMYFRAVKNGN